jgi:hypothetical protein
MQFILMHISLDIFEIIKQKFWDFHTQILISNLLYSLNVVSCYSKTLKHVIKTMTDQQAKCS